MKKQNLQLLMILACIVLGLVVLIFFFCGEVGSRGGIDPVAKPGRYDLKISGSGTVKNLKIENNGVTIYEEDDPMTLSCLVPGLSLEPGKIHYSCEIEGSTDPSFRLRYHSPEVVRSGEIKIHSAEKKSGKKQYYRLSIPEDRQYLLQVKGCGGLSMSLWDSKAERFLFKNKNSLKFNLEEGREYIVAIDHHKIKAFCGNIQFSFRMLPDKKKKGQGSRNR